MKIKIQDKVYIVEKGNYTESEVKLIFDVIQRTITSVLDNINCKFDYEFREDYYFVKACLPCGVELVAEKKEDFLAIFY